jgi:cobalamin biosynthesis Mg chelatase CobN
MDRDEVKYVRDERFSVQHRLLEEKIRNSCMNKNGQVGSRYRLFRSKRGAYGAGASRRSRST